MIGRIWAIALNTFREAVRIRVLYGILVLVVGANLMTLVLGQMVSTEQARVTRDSATRPSALRLVTATSRRSALPRGAAAHDPLDLSKPLARWEFVVGKYVGMRCCQRAVAVSPSR